MPRRSKRDMGGKSFRLPAPRLAAATRLASHLELSLNKLVNQAVSEFLEKHGVAEQSSDPLHQALAAIALTRMQGEPLDVDEGKPELGVCIRNAKETETMLNSIIRLARSVTGLPDYPPP